MDKTALARESLDIERANGAFQAANDGAPFCRAWPRERLARTRRNCILLARRDWRGRFRSSGQFDVYEIRKGGIQLYLVTGDTYPDASPRVFAGSNGNLLRLLSKVDLFTLSDWTSRSTLLDIAEEALHFMGGEP